LEVSHDRFTDFGELVRRELDSGPDVFDALFDFGDQGVAKVALGALRLTAETVEVRVEAAVALALGHAKTTAAVTADERAFEVVRVLVYLLA
jgi:hypothetical protein